MRPPSCLWYILYQENEQDGGIISHFLAQILVSLTICGSLYIHLERGCPVALTLKASSTHSCPVLDAGMDCLGLLEVHNCPSSSLRWTSKQTCLLRALTHVEENYVAPTSSSYCTHHMKVQRCPQQLQGVKGEIFLRHIALKSFWSRIWWWSTCCHRRCSCALKVGGDKE